MKDEWKKYPPLVRLCTHCFNSTIRIIKVVNDIIFFESPPNKITLPPLKYTFPLRISNTKDNFHHRLHSKMHIQIMLRNAYVSISDKPLIPAKQCAAAFMHTISTVFCIVITKQEIFNSNWVVREGSGKVRHNQPWNEGVFPAPFGKAEKRTREFSPSRFSLGVNLKKIV